MKPLPKPNIVDLWESYGGTVLSGNGWRKATCVLHEDNSPSASVNEDECRWNCFVCQASGDAIDLIMEKTGAGFPDAKRVAESLLGGGGGPVPRERERSGLLPGRSGNRPSGGSWTPPWKGL